MGYFFRGGAGVFFYSSFRRTPVHPFGGIATFSTTCLTIRYSTLHLFSLCHSSGGWTGEESPRDQSIARLFDAIFPVCGLFFFMNSGMCVRAVYAV